MALSIILLTVTAGRMMASAKPGKKFSIDKLQTTLVELERLSEKPKKELSLRESIYFLRDKLRLTLKKGYSYQDLSSLLEKQEILISAATLKQYLTEIDKGAAKGKRVAKSGQASQPAPLVRSPEPVATTPEASVQETPEQLKGDLGELQREAPQQSDSVDGVESQQETGRTVKRKTRELSKSSLDLSSEFNQY